LVAVAREGAFIAKVERSDKAKIPVSPTISRGKPGCGEEALAPRQVACYTASPFYDKDNS